MVRSLKSIYHLLQGIAAVVRFGFPGRKLTIIGVTGTDGKTTTTSLIYHILKKNRIKASMITSVQAVIAGREYDTGFHVTTPSAFFIQKCLREAVDHGDTHVVLEVTSHGLSQHRVFGIPFSIGVITNVTHEHLDWHRSFEEYRDTKVSLLRRSKVAVINRDDTELYNGVIERIRHKRLVSFAIRRDAVVSPRTYRFVTKLPGQFNKYNCLAALAVSYALGIPKGKAIGALRTFSGVKGRMETVLKKPFTVIVDFAHTPNALEQVLKTVRKMTRKKKLIHVFGSAGLRDASKRPMMGAASSRYADTILLTEEDYRTENVDTIIDQIALGIDSTKEVFREPDRARAIAKAFELATPGDIILLTGKGHETSLCRGKVEYPWSDQLAVKKALIQLRKKKV